MLSTSRDADKQASAKGAETARLQTSAPALEIGARLPQQGQLCPVTESDIGAAAPVDVVR